MDTERFRDQPVGTFFSRSGGRSLTGSYNTFVKIDQTSWKLCAEDATWVDTFSNDSLQAWLDDKNKRFLYWSFS